MSHIFRYFDWAGIMCVVFFSWLMETSKSSRLLTCRQLVFSEPPLLVPDLPGSWLWLQISILILLESHTDGIILHMQEIAYIPLHQSIACSNNDCAVTLNFVFISTVFDKTQNRLWCELFNPSLLYCVYVRQKKRV